MTAIEFRITFQKETTAHAAPAEWITVREIFRIINREPNDFRLFAGGERLANLQRILKVDGQEFLLLEAI